MQLAKTHKFFITIQGEAEAQFFPLNESLEWEYEKAVKEFPRKVLNTELKITNTDEHNTFEKLFALERGLQPCLEIPIRIEETCICNGQTTISNWNGFLPFRKGKWDRLNCIAQIKPIPDDSIKCIVENWQKKQNILSINNKFYVATLAGDLEYKTKSSKPDGYGWTVYQEFFVYTADNTGGDGDYVTTRWVRQSRDSEADGFQFDSETGKYYAFVPTGPYKDVTAWSGPANPEPDDVVGERTRTYKIIDLRVDNSVRLEDVLALYLGSCGANIVSNFFGINPDLTAPDNTAYRYANEYLGNIKILKSSDVIRYDNSQKATVFEIDFKEFWEDLKRMFWIKAFYDGDTDTVYIEHISYSTLNKKINISNNPQIKGLDRYEYIDVKFPLEETWNFAFKTGNEDFDNAKVEYKYNCSNQDEESNKVSYDLKWIVSNIAYLYNNELLVEDENFMDKMVLVSSSGTLIRSMAGIYNTTNINGPLAYTKLLENLGVYDRPVLYGTMNGLEVQFEDVIKQRSQEIVLDVDCETLNSFNPSIAVQTQIGLGEVEKLVYKDPEKNIKMTIQI